MKKYLHDRNTKYYIENICHIAEYIVVMQCIFCFILKPKSLSFTCSHSLSLVFISCTTRCHLLRLVLSLVVTRCHWLSFVVPLIVIRCHSLPLVVQLIVIRCYSMYHSSVFINDLFWLLVLGTLRTHSGRSTSKLNLKGSFFSTLNKFILSLS